MMRYFRTGNASRPYNVSGKMVYFESTGRSPGGGTFGIYGTSDESLASAIASYGPPIYEIQQDQYDELKKNSTTILQQSQLSIPVTQQNLAQQVATPAAGGGDADDVSELILEAADMDPDVDPSPRPARNKRATKK